MWQGDDIEFACDGDDDGGLTYTLSIQMECGAPYIGCERYRLTLSWPVGSTNHSWCLGDGIGGEHVEVLVNEPCDCDPLSLTFGPFSLITQRSGTVSARGLLRLLR